MAEAFARSVAIVDGLPPPKWQGANAGEQWHKDLVLAGKHQGGGNYFVILGCPWQVSTTVMPLIEIDGETLLAGPERGDTVLNISPGIKFRPFHSDHWQVGASLGVPISEQEEFHARAVFAAFYHF
jgi:hypothetical protein